LTSAQLRQIASSGYSHLNTNQRIQAACAEHTNFIKSNFVLGGDLHILKTKDIVFDYKGMAHQPRLGNLDPTTVRKYSAQAKNGVNGVFGIRKPITVYWSTVQQSFIGIKGHHRYSAAREIGYNYIIAHIDDIFPSLSKQEQIDCLMSDNAFADNGMQSCTRSIAEALKATLQDETFMRAERKMQQQLQEKLKSCNEESRRKEIEKNIKEISKKIRGPLDILAQKWNPSTASSSNKTLVTRALNNYQAKHLVQVFNHTTKQRKAYISHAVNTLGNDDLYFDWGQAVTNNNVQINLPTAEFLAKVREYKKANNSGKLPSSFTFFTCIPGGVKDYQHLFQLRSRIEESIIDRVADVYPSVPRHFKFLGQVLNQNSPCAEDPKKLYDSSYVTSYIKQSKKN